MQSYLDCIPCAMQQLLRTARMLTNDEEVQLEVLVQAGRALEYIRLTDSPPEMVVGLYARLAAVTGNSDPYRLLRKESTRKALALYPAMKAYAAAARDPLYAAARIAAAGNLIDYGAVGEEIHLEEEVMALLQADVRWDDFERFRKDLQAAAWVLYLGDNAGETVFDRVFIEEMKKPVTYVVRGGPAINDALLEDAEEAGLQDVADVLPSGVAATGTLLHRCTRQVVDRFNSAPLIISKGQGNYETLNETRGPVYFVLKVKCRVVSDLLGKPVGALVFQRSEQYTGTGEQG